MDCYPIYLFIIRFIRDFYGGNTCLGVSGKVVRNEEGGGGIFVITNLSLMMFLGDTLKVSHDFINIEFM